MLRVGERAATSRPAPSSSASHLAARVAVARVHGLVVGAPQHLQGGHAHEQQAARPQHARHLAHGRAVVRRPSGGRARRTTSRSRRRRRGRAARAALAARPRPRRGCGRSAAPRPRGRRPPARPSAPRWAGCSRCRSPRRGCARVRAAVGPAARPSRAQADGAHARRTTTGVSSASYMRSYSSRFIARPPTATIRTRSTSACPPGETSRASSLRPRRASAAAGGRAPASREAGAERPLRDGRAVQRQAQRARPLRRARARSPGRAVDDGQRRRRARPSTSRQTAAPQGWRTLQPSPSSASSGREVAHVDHAARGRPREQRPCRPGGRSAPAGRSCRAREDPVGGPGRGRARRRRRAGARCSRPRAGRRRCRRAGCGSSRYCSMKRRFQATSSAPAERGDSATGGARPTSRTSVEAARPGRGRAAAGRERTARCRSRRSTTGAGWRSRGPAGERGQRRQGIAMPARSAQGEAEDARARAAGVQKRRPCRDAKGCRARRPRQGRRRAASRVGEDGAAARAIRARRRAAIASARRRPRRRLHATVTSTPATKASAAHPGHQLVPQRAPFRTGRAGSRRR